MIITLMLIQVIFSFAGIFVNWKYFIVIPFVLACIVFVMSLNGESLFMQVCWFISALLNGMIMNNRVISKNKHYD